ncbi:hypothetical protein C2U70_16545 [Bradyrhizobium guangdongense]|uniref:Ig-like domain-containing protein n=1 Tax=Bradyrhizobium guangdongense TaxID=1325090 RepID=UPI001129DAFB|nr:Ig-like domain-containing protein [Bradyrhizobium guangdongense]TPQ34651.1 hypothetical protein C2U70_16545 [Bradyrhizobium guangdongense]
MARHPAARHHPLLWLFRACFLLAVAIAILAADSRSGRADDDTVPDLSGEWKIKVGDQERRLVLTQDGTTLKGKATRTDGKTTFELVGSVDKTKSATLKLYWDFAELESTSKEAWAAALDKRKDTQHPGLLPVEAEVKLSYRRDKDTAMELLDGGLKRPQIKDERDKDDKFVKLTAVEDESFDVEITRQVAPLKSFAFSTADPDSALKEGASWRPFRITGELEKAPAGSDPTAEVVVTNQRTKESVRVTLHPREKGAVEMVSGAVDVKRIGDPDGWSVPGTEYALRAATGDVLRASSGKLQVDLTIRDGVDTTAAPELPSYRLITGQTEVTFDPEERKTAPIELKLVDGNGKAVPLQKIVWQIDGVETHPVSITDENGLARLEFLPTASGKFQPAYDGLPLGGEVSAGTLSVTAIPLDPNITIQLGSAMPTYQVTLNYPTLVKMLDENGNEAPVLVGAQERFVRVILGTRLAKLAPASVAVDVLTKTQGGWTTLPEIRGGVDSFQVKADKTPVRGMYQSTKTIPVARALFRTKVSTLHLTVAGRETVFPVYEDRGTYSTEIARQVLDRLDGLLATAQRDQRLSDEGRAELAAKAQMLKTAKMLFDEAEGNIAAPAIRLAIAEAYSSLLTDDGDPDQLGGPAKMKVSGLKKEYQFASQVEGQRVTAAVDASLANLGAQVDSFVNAMQMAAVMAITGPAADFYVLFSGRTIEGQRAGTLERVLAGTAAVSGLILTVAPPLAASARAELALQRMQLAEERVLTVTLERAMARLPEFEITSAQVAQILSKVPKLTNPTKKMAKAIKSAEAESQKLNDAEKELAHFKDKLAKANDELNAMKTELANRVASGNTRNKKLITKIEDKKGAIEQANKSIDMRNKNIANIKANLAVIETKMAEARLERGLSKSELMTMHAEKRLPAQNDKVNGRTVASVYESQNAEVLKPYFPGKTFKENKPMELPGTFVGSEAKPETKYAPTTWGVDFAVDAAEERGHMRPDLAILDPETGEMFEIKYFVKESGGTEEGWMAQLIPSVEKGRLAQYKYVRDHRASLGQSLAFNDVWNDVLSRPLYVATPREMSARFQNILKASVRGAGKNVKFIVIPVPLDAWAATIPD